MLETAQKTTAVRGEIGARNCTGRPTKEAVRRRLLTLGSLDGRTTAAKRARRLAAALADELGGAITASQAAAVERAATLVALAEDVRSRRLADDESVSLEDLVRIDAAADRAIRRLGIKPTEAPPTMTIQEVLAAEAAAEQTPGAEAELAATGDAAAERAEPGDADLDEASRDESAADT